MSTTSSCDAVIAEFAWWSQTCPNPMVATVEWDGDDWNVCADHFAAFRKGVSA